MWLKLLQKNSIQELIKPQFVNGRWRGAIINGREKAELRTYFQKAGVPWIYEKETPEVHESSTYNRKPKGHFIERNYEVRLANIRKALSTQDDRLEKLRQDKINNKPWSGYDRLIAGTMKGLAQSGAEAKKGGKSGAAQRAAEAAENKELGIKSGPKKQGSKTGITSKGGSLGKKEREVLQMARGNIGYEIGGPSSSSTSQEEKK